VETAQESDCPLGRQVLCQRGEPDDIDKQHADILGTAGVDRVATGGQLANDIRREIPGEIRVRAFRNHLPQHQPARAPNRKGQDCGGQK
jgi:hypothetical protein